jgi:hypothetical protein
VSVDNPVPINNLPPASLPLSPNDRFIVGQGGYARSIAPGFISVATGLVGQDYLITATPYQIPSGINYFGVNNTTGGDIYLTPQQIPGLLVPVLIKDVGRTGFNVFLNGTMDGAVNPRLIGVVAGWAWIMWSGTQWERVG